MHTMLEMSMDTDPKSVVWILQQFDAEQRVCEAGGACHHYVLRLRCASRLTAGATKPL
uniref:Uncharacterized protein n=1 Tax=Ralstonia solanacearum TaxID=305 RepID=A0A0S4U1F2_RALSL|nr:protein of unknown function [Ralstonia solanacearum]